MPNNPQETIHQRRKRVWITIRQYPGLTEIEITQRMRMAENQRRTINNDLRALEDEGRIYKEGRCWFALDFDKTRLRPFELSPEEAMTLYLATRLFVKQQDKRNEPAETALLQLAHVLTSDAGIGQEIEQAARELAQRQEKRGFQSIFRTVIRGYIYRKKVKISYRPLNGRRFDTTFATYLVEPSAIGFSTYIIGHSQSNYVDGIRSYKLERIEKAEMTRQEYVVPADFPGLDILRNAWSIISGEETERIVLCFSPRVTERVLETQWHPSQDHRPDPDQPGYLRWWVDIADTTDMLPWIRSWGSDVEVLEPEDLRQTVIAGVERSSRKYKITTQTYSHDNRLLQLWGKTGKRDTDYHPALYHMLDVAHVAQQLLRSQASPRWRHVLAAALNTDVNTLHEWLPWLIALHDVGKLSVPFQILNAKQMERLKQEGFKFGRAQRADTRKLHHSIVGRLLLTEMAADWPRNLRTAFLEMVSGHHGTYQAETPSHQEDLAYIQEPLEWGQLRQHAVRLLQSYLLQNWPDPLPEPDNVSSAIVALNGFCILCDWLGSDEAYFKAKPYMSLNEYVLHSRQQAYQRVKDAGFFQLVVSRAPTTFAKLFEFAPRPLQAEIDRIPAELLSGPTLTIIEAPTGEGKTEAAFALARRIAALRGTDEMYVALPTTATSNAMYKRTQEHLQKRLGLPDHLVRLVHGQSFLAQDDLTVDPLRNGDGEELSSLEWFSPKKKALLAPFGVGTVDQAELAALNVRHNALRMIGLAAKVVILDEVHAYDTYMTTIIKRMLTWLAALGSSVILLSATLPISRRYQLAQAFAGDIAVDLETVDVYPSLLTIGKTVYTPDRPIAVYQPHKVIWLEVLHYTDEQAPEKARWLLEKVQNGGCACWITNTVGRAQAIFKHLQAIAPVDVDLALLHGRFPQEDRQNLEIDILDEYGRRGTRPYKGIVVGTQVLEQSLDLDFDVMVTDLAPIDLILQRAGRLHRHNREKAARHGYGSPHLFINMELAKADRAIYSEYILRMTEQVLNDRTQLALPTDYRLLVEAVYDPTPPLRDAPLYAAWRKLRADAIKLEEEAQQRLTSEPDPEEPFCEDANRQGFEEDESSSAWVVAQTRWGQESITVVPLMRVDETAELVLAENNRRIPLKEKAGREDQLRLLRRSIRISNPVLVKHLKGQADKEKMFAESALLKHCIPLWLEPDEKENNVFISYELPQPVYLHRELGLVFGEFSPEEGISVY